MRYRNLWRNTVFMAYFNALAVAATVSLWQLGRGASIWGWLGVLLCTAPLLIYVSYALLTLRVARTSKRLPLVGAQALLGTGLAGYGALTSSGGYVPLGLSVSFLVGFVWYAYSFAGFLKARPSDRLAKGLRLPEFVLRNAQGQAIRSEQLLQRPMVLVFYRGNWCPFCMAQVKELAQRYREIDALGAGIAFISPQPLAKTAALAERFGIPAEFLVDEGALLARRLGIVAEYGIPTGLHLLGYSSDTVMPTVVITEASGRILWADETDNYRVRPEPDTYIEVLRGGRLATA